MLKQWVKENFLTIPDDVIGKKVNAKQGYKKYENHYITTIRPDTYEVTISDNINKKGGYIVGFENVTFLWKFLLFDSCKECGENVEDEAWLSLKSAVR